jgi:glutamate racemase
MYLTDIKDSKLDTIILGCTHYPLLKNQIQRFFGDKINLVDSGDAVGYEVKTFISKNNYQQIRKLEHLAVLLLMNLKVLTNMLKNF